MVFTTLEQLRSGQFIFGRLSSEFSNNGEDIVIKERENDISAAAQAAKDGSYEAVDTVLLFCRSGRNPYLFCGRITPSSGSSITDDTDDDDNDDDDDADEVQDEDASRGTLWFVSSRHLCQFMLDSHQQGLPLKRSQCNRGAARQVSG
jgi:hypothetical protein